MAESWVINASPTILLAKAGLMELIPKLTTRFVIPQPVVEEILNVRGKDAAANWLQQSGLISAAKPHLQNIRNAGGYIGDKHFAAALKQAGENL